MAVNLLSNTDWRAIAVRRKGSKDIKGIRFYCPKHSAKEIMSDIVEYNTLHLPSRTYIALTKQKKIQQNIRMQGLDTLDNQELHRV